MKNGLKYIKILIQSLKVISVCVTEAYLDPSRTTTMETFWENS